ncbi:MAG: HIT domain-containing protein [Opitutales bacterium]|nr:HIT domain-containing protein [Opitutales bacterium]
MEHLHAYWRMEYVEAPRLPDSASPFQDLIASGDDKKALIVYRGQHTCLMLNRFPYNAGHLLILPFREISDLPDLQTGERAEFMQQMINGETLLRQAIKPDGFNIGINIGKSAGAGLPTHLHAHIVPRWTGDSNFMPVIGGTSVLPISLEKLWQRLTDVAREILPAYE